MATSIIEIILRLKNEAAAAIKTAANDIKRLGEGVAGLSDKGDVGANAVNRMTEATKQFKAEATELEEIIKKVGVALAAYFTFGQVKAAVEAAAQVQVAGTVLQIVGRNAGIAAEDLNKADKAIQKLGITAEASRKSLTSFIQAGLAGLNGKDLNKAAELARASQDLAVVSGQNSSETFQRLITNIQQMDAQGLKFQGLTVERDRAEQKFAETIGKTTSELNKQEKQQAFMNATLVEAKKLTGTYEAAMGDAAKQVQSLARLQNELQVSIGQNLLPAYSSLVEEFGLFLKQAKLVTDIEGVQGENAIALGEAVKTLASGIRVLSVALIEHIGIITEVVKAYAAFRILTVVLSGLAPALAVASAGVTGLAFSLGKIVAANPVAAIVAVGVAAYELGKLLQDLEFLDIGKGLKEEMYLVAAAVTTLWVGLSNAFLDLGDWMEAASVKVQGFLRILSPEAVDRRLKEIGDRIKARAEETRRAQDQFSETLSNVGDNVEDPGKSVRAEQIESYKKVTREALDSAEKKAAAETNLAKVQRIGSEQEKAAAVEKLSLASKDLKAKEAQRDAIEVQIKSVKGLSEADKQQKAEALDRIRQGIALGKQQEAVDEARKKIGLVSSTGEDKLGAFDGINSAFAILMKEFTRNADTAGEAFGKAFENGSAALKLFVDQAKSVDDIATALQGVDSAARLTAEGVSAAKETLKFNQQKAAIKELQDTLAGFNAQIDKLRSIGAFVSSLGSDQVKAAGDLKRVFVEIGAAGKTADEVLRSLEEAARGTSDRNKLVTGVFFGNFQDKLKISEPVFQTNQEKDKIKELARLDAERFQQRISEAKQSYASEITLINETISRERALVNERNRAAFEGAKVTELNSSRTNLKENEVVNSSGKVLSTLKTLGEQQAAVVQASNARLEAIEAESLAKRIAAAKTYYETLKGLQAEALQKFNEAAQKIIAIEAQQKALKKTSDDEQREIARRGMSQEEANADKLREIDEVEEARKKAKKEGDLALAKELAVQEVELVKKANADKLISDKDLGDKLKSLREEQNKALEEEKAVQAKIQVDNLKAYQDLSKALDELTKQLGDLSKQQVQTILVSLDETSLKAATDAVTAAFSKLDIKVKVTPDSSSTSLNQGFATGGLVGGPGTDTSDNLLAAVSPGEYWTKAKAVRHYGVEVFHKLNNMRIPREIVAYLLGSTKGSSSMVRDSKDVASSVSNRSDTLRFASGGLVPYQSYRDSSVVELHKAFHNYKEVIATILSATNTHRFAEGGLVPSVSKTSKSYVNTAVSGLKNVFNKSKALVSSVFSRAGTVKFADGGLVPSRSSVLNISKSMISSVLNSPRTPRFDVANFGKDVTNISNNHFDQNSSKESSANTESAQRSQEVAVTVNIGGKKSRLFGDRKNVAALVESLKRIEGTI